jgi:hypothetical protein
MTGGAGNTFALIPGTITTPGGTAVINFTLNPAQFTLPKGKMVLGIDVIPEQGSSVQPLISQVNNQHGQIIPQAIHTIYNPHLSHVAVARGVGTRAVLAPVSLYPHQPTRSATFSVVITGEANTSGAFLVGFYLPGDVNGTGTVDQSSITTIRGLVGATTKSSNYSFDADANRDGRIGKIDVSYAMQNLGVTTTVTPLVTAQMDPASDTGIQGDRITSAQTVHFYGNGTPGATITYTETGSKPTTLTTTVGTDTTYNLMVPIGNGVNNFTVTSVDPFGQTITGTISPVTYNTNPPNYAIPLTHTVTTSAQSPTATNTTTTAQ